MATTLCFSAHRRTRNVVERGIGQLKRRFHVLHSEIRVKPPAKLCRIVEVCAMLHNICKDRNIPPPAVNEDDGDNLPADVQEPLAEQHQPAGGRRRPGIIYRDAFVNRHFK